MTVSDFQSKIIRTNLVPGECSVGDLFFAAPAAEMPTQLIWLNGSFEERERVDL